MSLTPIRRTACDGPCAQLCTDAGFAAAYHAHRARLVSGARAVLGDEQLAEDAVQEAFLRAWAACASFRPEEGPPLISWLLRITRNVVIDHIRARAARPQLTAVAPDAHREPPDHRCETDRVELRAVLAAALATVSEQHRWALLLAVVQDRAYPDVATELGVPLGTVKSRVFYGLRGMRAALGAP